MEYHIGQIFEGMYPPDAADWCNENNCFINEMEPIGDVRRFIILAVPAPTPEQEAERVGNLQCTKRVFMLMLQQLGITYSQVKALISTNEQAQMEWELCVELQRKNPLLDQLASQFGITSKQLDDLFKFANGEITQEEFLGE